MNYFKEILLLFILTVAVNLSDAQVLVDTMKQDEICVHECKNTVFPLPNKKVDPQGKYVKSCCMRGCRFFNLIDLRKEYDLNNSNSSLDDCNASCKESYNLNQNLFACIIGCTTMARRSGMTAHFRIDIRVEDGVNPNMILGSPDSDKSEILHPQLPGWWNSVDEEIELPQSPLKYIQYVDYGNPLDNIKEAEKITVGSSDWLQCASKHIGVPKWMLAFAIVCTILAAVWFYLAQERSSNSIDKTPLIDSNLTNSKMMVYLPEEVLTHKKPPPKYSDVVDTNDLALKV